MAVGHTRSPGYRKSSDRNAAQVNSIGQRGRGCETKGIKVVVALARTRNPPCTRGLRGEARTRSVVRAPVSSCVNAGGSGVL